MHIQTYHTYMSYSFEYCRRNIMRNNHPLLLEQNGVLLYALESNIALRNPQKTLQYVLCGRRLSCAGNLKGKQPKKLVGKDTTSIEVEGLTGTCVE